MAYTVKQLAKLSGVSIRTLHWYDQKNLLKPAYVAANGYRYYEEKELLLLQQILFYRELGFSLDDIEKMISLDDFSTLEALKAHKISLQSEVDRIQQLIATVDKTVAYLGGKTKMNAKEFYYGFDSKTQKQHEQYLVEEGIASQELIDEANAKVKDWSDEDKNHFIQKIEQIMQALINAIDNDLEANDPVVQKLMAEHYHWLEKSWSPDKEKYLGLIELYQTPDFRSFYDDRDPRLLDFFVAAMRVYAEKKFS